ncbi:MAG: TlyA family RNA methyltransferase [Alphaproteobacteria bacterium]|nr:TlyA family RNA methyltransferase [Alphaproteobacteria bacterium]MCB9792932.1 TlyA family RNA methyltransferase [Alphaproteobacteria bacterium]
MSGKVPKERADVLLVKAGLAPSRQRAQALIMAGKVLADDQPVQKAGARLPVDAALRLKGEDIPFVSRGGLKLDAALEAFAVPVAGRSCADLGASTGGFTDCLLQRGAAKVYAIDVGYGQLAWKLRQDPRVVVMERTNARHLESLPEPVSLLVGDLSFISLKLILPTIVRLTAPGADCVLLVKPQFEVGREGLGSGGRVKDEELRARAIAEVLDAAREAGFEALGDVPSPVAGAKAGNVEHLVWLQRAS